MLKSFGKMKKVFSGGKKIISSGEAILNTLEYKDGDVFIAHCLEFDLVAQGETLEEARHNLVDLIKSHTSFAIRKDVEDKCLFHPAPKKYWDILHHFQSRMARKVFLKGKLSRQDILRKMNCQYAHI